MEYWPRDDVTGRRLVDALVSVANSANNVFAGRNTVDSIDAYLTWVGQATFNLQSVLTPPDVTALVRTEQFRSIQSNPAFSTPTLLAVQAEVMERQRMLAAAASDTAKLLGRWSDKSEAVELAVVDTCVYLQHEFDIEHVDWHATLELNRRSSKGVRIIMPLLVVDELDNAKRDQVRSRARTTLKALWANLGGDPHQQWVLSEDTPGTVDGVTVELLVDAPHHVRLPRPDGELVARARAIQDLIGKPMHFVTFDTGAAFRARVAGLTTHRLDRDLQAGP